MTRLIVLSLIIMVWSCSGNPPAKPEAGTTRVIESTSSTFDKRNIKTYLEEDYDSLQFYSDADWATLKGKQPLTGDTFSYPFLCYAFKDDTLQVHFFFNQHRFFHWNFTRSKDMLYTRLAHFDKAAMDTIQNYFIYRPGYQLQVKCFNPDLFQSKKLEVRSVVKTTSLDSSKITQQMYLATYGRRSVSLDDILRFDSTQLSSEFSYYAETTLGIENEKLYQLSQYQEEDGKEMRDPAKVLKNADLEYPSFLFFYAGVFAIWTAL